MKKVLNILLTCIVLISSLMVFTPQALAQQNCEKIVNQGANTVENSWFTQKTATIAWYPGVISTDVKYDICTPTAVMRINGNDWNKLVSEGKLEGIRYEVYSYGEKDGNFQNFLFRQMKDKTPVTITAADFRK